MCDTFVIRGRWTSDGATILGKNSDREPNEAQAVERIPAQRHRRPALRCTYIEVPQVERTFEVVLSRPFHMWGAEMGVNEHGLAIGNEAVFTRIPFRRKNDGLTGMDLLRLALERCQTAEEALECITGLLERYGQDACGGYQNRRFFYHNSFLLADPEDAWVLETAGRHWAARRVTDFAAISNVLTIGEDFDRISSRAVNFAREKGWAKRGRPFHFAKAFSDRFYTRLARGKARRATSLACLRGSAGRFTLREAFELLRSHHPAGERFRPGRSSTASLCMHPTGLLNPSQTTGSMVAQLRPQKRSVVWLTGTSMPCLSAFKPFFLRAADCPLFALSAPGPTPDDSLWWRAEGLLRKMCLDYRGAQELVGPTVRGWEQSWRGRAAEESAALSRSALEAHLQGLVEWGKMFQPPRKRTSQVPFTYAWYLARISRSAGLRLL